jgi:hypothetical protein
MDKMRSKQKEFCRKEKERAKFYEKLDMNIQIMNNDTMSKTQFGKTTNFCNNLRDCIDSQNDYLKVCAMNVEIRVFVLRKLSIRDSEDSYVEDLYYEDYHQCEKRLCRWIR